MKNLLIGITGNKGAGKDLSANMLSYIDTVDEADYKGYLENWFFPQIEIHHFADSLKDIISILFGINREDLDDRKKKDELYYNVKTKTYKKLEDIEKEDDYYIVDNIIQNDPSRPIFNGVYNMLMKYDNYYIKLRALLQFIGTEIFQNVFSPHVWINTVKFKLTGRDIIADVRFIKEADFISDNNGVLINIVNTKYINKTDNHASEMELSGFKFNYTIIWDGDNKEYLFNELVKFYNDIK